MKSNAPGQLLGFGIQFARATLRLLQSGPNEEVSVEVLGDVTLINSKKEMIAEEDKSSINSNPLTDRSIDLWKTFFNWAEAVKNNEIDINTTQFVLYCNQSGRLAIVNNFSSAFDSLEAKSALKNAEKKLADINSKHEIWIYYDYLVNHNKQLLIQIIQRFKLQIGQGAGYTELRLELLKKHIHETQIDFFVNSLEGWVSEEIKEKISRKHPAIITWEDFNHQFLVLFDRARTRELIDYTIQYQIEEDTVQEETLKKPNYLLQLESINTSEDEIIEAISDYLKAEVNRNMWIENDIIDEVIAEDFQKKLKKFWRLEKKKVMLLSKHLDHIDQGQLLLAECLQRKELIRNMDPPFSTIPGTYHALADEFTVGWHPIWERIFNKGEKL